MTRPHRLLLIAFLESFAVVLVERGVYFFTDKVLAFSGALNLWLALAFGGSYVAGALLSHRAAGRQGEKRLLAVCLLGQAACYVALAVGVCLEGPAGGVVFVGSAALGLLNGVKWPLIESYIGAGQTQVGQLRAVGRFNVAWASAVPAALALAGVLIRFVPPGLFALGAAVNLVSLWLMRPLPSRPAHMPHDHPDRPQADQLARYRALLGASRWQMIASYASMWIIAALIPGILTERLGFGVMPATALSGLLDVFRLLAFVTLGSVPGWHNRFSPVLATMVALPAGLFMVLFGQSATVVLLGELLFGLGAGLTYYMALYYVMVVKNASVDAGGSHEGLIGLGFFIGPLAGLAGTYLATSSGHYAAGMLGGVGPLLAVCTVGAAWPIATYLRTAMRAAQNSQSRL